MLVAARRARFRRVLDGEETVILPTVYDAVSARIVEMAGFPFRVAVQAMHEFKVACLGADLAQALNQAETQAAAAMHCKPGRLIDD